MATGIRPDEDALATSVEEETEDVAAAEEAAAEPEAATATAELPLELSRYFSKNSRPLPGIGPVDVDQKARAVMTELVLFSYLMVMVSAY